MTSFREWWKGRPGRVGARGVGMALWFVLGLSAGVAVAADCRAAILTAATSAGVALWVGLR